MVNMEIMDMPVAVLRAADQGMRTLLENRKTKVSNVIEVKIPEVMARPMARGGDMVGCADWR